MPMMGGKQALTLDDSGAPHVPESDADWLDWVAASKTRNYLLEDPLLDWLRLYGPAKGFEPDVIDERTSFRDFVFEKGILFEDRVMALLRSKGVEVVEIASDVTHGRQLAMAERTVDAMADGAEMIAQGVLRDAEMRTYGMPDLLVRSDVLAFYFPDAIPSEEVGVDAPGIGLADRHYRVVDVKFKTLALKQDGSLSAEADLLPYQSQVWIYNHALARIQGYRPGFAYLLGRNWKHTSGEKERGAGCFDRLGPVPMERTFPGRDGASLEELSMAAADWIRAVRKEGADWEVLPNPSRAELFPHMRHYRDDPWRGAKSTIADALAELTLLPRMNPAGRRDAHRHGIERWTDPAVSARALGIAGEKSARQCDAVLAANRSDPPVVLPATLSRADPDWREPARLELYVDFETVSNLDDDFTQLPAEGGQPLIFQIGCGRMRDGEWLFDQWTTDRLDEPSEAVIIDAFIDRLRALVDEAGAQLEGARLYHWSAAEVSTLVSAYNSAVRRHPDKDWPQQLPWFDLLGRVVRPAPLTVTGAFGFGLKAIATSMHRLGLIETAWGEGPTDGMGAMIGAWFVEHETAYFGTRLIDHELMREIAAYNEVDCRVMAEILWWLRAREAT